MPTKTDSTTPTPSTIPAESDPGVRPVAEQRLYELWAELRDLQAAAALLEWDQETQMPAAANGARGDVLATLAALEHRALIAAELTEVIDECATGAAPGSLLEAQARVAREAVEKARKIPERLQREIATARSEALGAWQEAKTNSEFALFEKPLARFVALCREKAAALAEDGRLYDADLSVPWQECAWVRAALGKGASGAKNAAE